MWRIYLPFTNMKVTSERSITLQEGRDTDNGQLSDECHRRFTRILSFCLSCLFCTLIIHPCSIPLYDIIVHFLTNGDKS